MKAIKKADKEKVINNYMVKLGIDRKEAEDLYAFDNDEIKNDTVEMLSSKAKQCGRHYVRNKVSNTKTAKKDPTDTVKINMINDIYNLLQGFTDVTNLLIANPTKELTFNLCNDNFSLSLIRHRK